MNIRDYIYYIFYKFSIRTNRRNYYQHNDIVIYTYSRNQVGITKQCALHLPSSNFAF